ncbi:MULTISPECIES: hypothetical protein [Terribacillus]|uniref:Type IV pilus assembly protein PilN n=1 Tax=Terribacillus saccharophilus TaxID=361277 RepID=A0ABX4H116_9BACI|nr:MULTISPECIES: hypothetical protein [Terribacillus]PAD36424.1 hypothetical protein CHH56_04270 [Terribacillus saccharophilus]PAD97088.1 hypothetical protein CHH50_04945 [Terribacillus saccharophilus]PAE00836.1 hypothetical protein CHH48_04970 [Terribacillus saccharophilus]VVM32980.1 hypothetical protein [Terribacillus sp. AE2B 122]
MLEINLLRKQSDTQRSPILFLSILGGLILICAVIFTWQLLAAKGQLSDLEAKQASNQTLLDAQTTVVAGNNGTALPYSVELMDKLQGLAPKGTDLISYTSPGTEPITVTLLVNSTDAAADYIQQVQDTSYVSRASLQSLTPQGADSFQAVFTITVDQAAWTSEVNGE